MDPITLEKAMNHWSKNYQTRPYALQHFLQDVCDTDELRRQHKMLLLTIMRELTQAKQHIQEEVESESSSSPTKRGFFRRGKRNKAKTADYAIFSVDASVPIVTAFTTLIPALLQGAEGKNSEQLKNYVCNHLFSFKLDSRTDNSLYLWFKKGEQQDELRLSEQQMREIVNLIYVGCCEYYGPVNADRWMAHCIKQVQAQFGDLSVQQLL